MNDNNIILLQTVIVMTDLSDADVLAGDVGAIVEVYEQPTLAYEVEFVNPDGSTRALLTLKPNQVRPLQATDVLTTRPISLAA